MSTEFLDKSDKKVEYIELIYDLIFIYLVGKNNALLHTVENGFFSAGAYVTYILSTLVVLQIWYFSTLFINRYGSNGISDHIGLFVNMYLLYYLADSTRMEWYGYYVRYNVAWGLILLNLAVQYGLQLRKRGGAAPWENRHLKYHMRLLLLQAAVVFCSIPLYKALRFPLAWVSLPLGFLAALFTERVDALMPVNFEHLTERVMLYIVFTFGEMIIGIAEYFEGEFGLNTVYFSLAAFLIVAGLFLVYGFLYNHIIDRERVTTGTGYILIHIVLIIALNNLTVAMEFMREPEISGVAKNIFLVASFLGYYLVMFLLERFACERYRAGLRAFATLAGAAAVFALAMALFYRNAMLSIAISVLFVYIVFGLIVRHWKRAGR